MADNDILAAVSAGEGPTQVIVLKRYDNDTGGAFAVHTTTWPNTTEANGDWTLKTHGFLTYHGQFQRNLMNEGFSRHEFSSLPEEFAHYIISNIMPLEWKKRPDAWDRVVVYSKEAL